MENDVQQRKLRSEVHSRILYSRITYSIIFLFVGLLALRMVSPFIVSIIVGAIFAICLFPLKEKLISRGMGPRASSYLIFAIFLVMFIAPASLFVKGLIEQAGSVSGNLSAHEITIGPIIESIRRWPLLNTILNYFVSGPAEIDEQIRSWLSGLSALVSTVALKQASQLPFLIVQTIFLLVSFFYFLLDGGKFVRFFSEVVPLEDEVRETLILSFKESSKSAIWSSLLAAASQAITMILGFLILNVPAPFLAAGATFIFSFIPFIGSFPVWGLAVIFLYFKKFYAKAIIMAVIGIFCGIIDNIVRAFVLNGGEESIHPLVGLASVLGGLQLFGLFGVLIGPIVVTLLLTLLKTFPRVMIGDS